MKEAPRIGPGGRGPSSGINSVLAVSARKLRVKPMYHPAPAPTVCEARITLATPCLSPLRCSFAQPPVYRPCPRAW